MTYYDRQNARNLRPGEPSQSEILAESRSIALKNLSESTGLAEDNPQLLAMVDFATSVGEGLSVQADAELTENARLIHSKICPGESWDTLDIDTQDRYREAAEALEFKLDEELEPV